MKKTTTNKTNIFVKAALHAGERSVGRCYIWYNQPKVPESLKEKLEKKKDR